MSFRTLFGYAAPYRAGLALSMSLMLLESAVALSIPWFGGQFAGRVLSNARLDSTSVVLGLVALFLAQAVLRVTNGFVFGRTAERLVADIRARIYDHLQALPLGFFHERRHGDVLALLTHEAAQLAGFISGTALNVVPMLLTVAGAVVLMFRIDGRLSLAAAFAIPVFYFLIKFMGRRLRPLALELQQAHANAVAIGDENLRMLPAIKSFTREPFESRRYGEGLRQLMQLAITQQRIYAIMAPSIQFIASSAVVLVLWLASDRISSGSMSSAELVSFLLYAALLTRPVSGLAGVYGQVQMARGTLERLQRVLAERPESVHEARTPLPALRGEVEFRGVTFAYPGRPPVLSGLNLRISAGETVAITGRNGAGKSTLAHLLLRLHQPEAGTIFVDGVDVTTVSLRSLRTQVGIVPQHVLLLNGSVRENIAYGQIDAPQDAIERAARVAEAHDFISRLPMGYDTPIGDQGVRLSGGQRQRIALARAILRNPRILILDEATAMFDPDGETRFLAGFREAMAKRTVILITHRAASLALADRVVDLEEPSRAPRDP